MLTKDQLQPIFERKYDRKDWYDILRQNFNVQKLNERPQLVSVTNNEFNASAYILGEINTSDDYKVGIYEVEVPGVKNITRNKVGLRNLLNQVYQTDVDAALVVFIQDSKWRFSYVSELTTRDPDTGTRQSQRTDTKRYTYLLGKDEKAKTAANRIANIKYTDTQRGINIKLENLKEAFSVEALNKEFYNVIAEKFSELVGGERNKNKKLFKYERLLQLPSISENKDANKIYHEFAVRLIGRIVFCWFLKMKKSNSGVSLLPEHLLSSKAVNDNTNYYHTILEKVFFQTLNTPVDQRDQSLPVGCELIPFLNGGLFEAQYQDYYNPNKITGYSVNINTLVVPDHWLLDLFEKLEQFNFTIDENSSTDIEVSVDPEMLGSIFENLLAEIDPDSGETARKATGSFYTPREIVDYMAVESLVYYLCNETGLNKGRLETVFQIEKELDFTKSETEDILIALDRLKILDPACGSGAFPIGVLQKIVIALQKLDRNAEWWIMQQINKNSDPTARAAVREKLKKNPDYARKIGIIQNTLYGVDIQPIAAEISKLRCFLTLIVDEHIDETRYNRGIEPLPNLEFKFVTANTLLKLPKETKQVQLFDEKNSKNTLELLTEIQRVRLDYLESYGVEKQILKERFNQLQNQIFRQEKSIGLVENNRAFKISTWKPFSHESTNWFDPEWMFGVKAFDILIGNPPYIGIQRLSDAATIKKMEYETFESTGDLYSLFYERGNDLLKEFGLLCYITSNKWINSNYGKSTRRFFSQKTNPLILIDFSKVKVFKSATVFVNIFLFEKGEPKNFLSACNVEGDEIPLIPLSKYFEINKVSLKNLTQEVWKINSGVGHNINQKIEKKGLRLKNWQNIEFFRGVTTGCNEVFNINENTRDELISIDPKNKDLIKPLLRGKDIKRYEYKFEGWFMLFTKQGTNIYEYPHIEKYLSNYYEILKPKKTIEEKSGRKPGSYKWFEIQDNTAYYALFSNPKIIWIEISDRANYAYDQEGMYLTNSAYFISGNHLKYLLVVLNSKLADYYFFQLTAKIAGGRKRYTKQYVEQIPIPVIPLALEEPFETMANKILLAKKNNENTVDIENEIDRMIYDLYELTEDEIEVIENAL